MSSLALLGLLIAVAATSWWLVGCLIDVLNRHQIVDTPDDRTLHQGSVPRGGGLAIVGLLVCGLLALAFVSGRYWVFGGLSLSVLAWSGMSWWDDQQNLSPRKRLLFQLLFSLLTILAFGYITVLEVAAGQLYSLSFLAPALSFIGVIWLANLYNFMDGMDGLAATQTIIAGITLSFWFWQVGDLHIALSCLILAAASYGFLLWNWQPAKIFMGDVGSITIGAFFATLIIYGNTRYQLPVIGFVLLLGVFVFDASLTISHRFLKREKIWLPHRSHLYQRLANAGIDHAKVVVALTVLMLLCSMIASITVLDRDKLLPGMIFELLLLFIYAALVVFVEARAKQRTAKSNQPADTEPDQ